MEPVCCATILTTSLITEKKGEKNSSYMFFIFWPARDQPMYTPLSFAIHYWNAVEVGSIVNHMQHDACDYFSDVFAGWGILKGTQYSLIENIRKYSVYEFSQKAWLEFTINSRNVVFIEILAHLSSSLRPFNHVCAASHSKKGHSLSTTQDLQVS